MAGNIMEYNGGAVVAMTGKDCVGIATDTRLGAQLQTVSCDFQKVFQMHDKLFVGLTGLGSDVQTMHENLRFRVNMYKYKEERDIAPETFMNMVCSMQYAKRFGPWFAEPIVAGLDKDDKPYISGSDVVGAPVETSDFIVGGTCTDNLYGTCESLYKKDMDKDELFEVLAQSLLAAVDRDALSGWGGVVHIITKEGVSTKTLKARQD